MGPPVAMETGAAGSPYRNLLPGRQGSGAVVTIPHCPNLLFLVEHRLGNGTLAATTREASGRCGRWGATRNFGPVRQRPGDQILNLAIGVRLPVGSRAAARLS